MADIAQEDEWVMEKGIVAKMYMTPRQIKSYREGRWVEGVHYKKHSPNPQATEGRAILSTTIQKLTGLLEMRDGYACWRGSSWERNQN
jgi:hypothetical protein